MFYGRLCPSVVMHPNFEIMFLVLLLYMCPKNV